MKLKGFFTSLVAIAMPISLQALLQNLVNMLDTVMIGRIGSVEIAAVGLGNQIFFILNMILFGITSGGAVFIAQFWGRKDLGGIRKSLGLMTIIAVVVAIIFTVLGLFIPNQLISLYSPDPEVIQVGGTYLRYVCLSYVPTAISFSITLAMRSTERVKLPLVCTSISLVTNIIANYFLIFQTIALPCMLRYFKPSNRKLLKIIIVICYLAYFLYTFLVHTPFNSYFNKMTLFEYLPIIFD